VNGLFCHRPACRFTTDFGIACHPESENPGSYSIDDP
jgi:hypothetical protein